MIESIKWIMFKNVFIGWVYSGLTPTIFFFPVKYPTLLNIKVLHDAIEEPFCLNGSIKNRKHLKIFLFHKSFFVVKEGSSDYKKLRKRCSLNKLWMVLCGTKNSFSMASLEEPFEALYFLGAYFRKNDLWKQNVLHKAIYISWFVSIAVMDWIMNIESAWGGWVFVPIGIRPCLHTSPPVGTRNVHQNVEAEDQVHSWEQLNTSQW